MRVGLFHVVVVLSVVVLDVAVSVVFLRTGRHHQAAGGKDKGDMFHVQTGFMRLDSDISENKDYRICAVWFFVSTLPMASVMFLSVTWSIWFY